VVALVGACHRLSPNEQKVIGTWASHSMDAAWQLTLNADHTLALAFDDDGKYAPSASGRWRLDGTELVIEVDLRSLPGASDQPAAGAKQIQTKTIVEFGRDRLDIKGEYPYLRVK
jgi:hypothetical protein